MSPCPPAIYTASRVACLVYFRTVHRLQVRGLDHIPPEGPVILAANHCSLLDPPLLGCAIATRVVHYLAKDTLFRGPLGWLLRRLQTVPVDRSRGDIAALRRALEILRGGGLLGLFPEGTRSRDGRMGPAKGGIGFLVARAGAPVVPARLEGTFRALPRGAILPRPVRLSVHYGVPIQPDEISALGADRAGYERVGALIMERIAALGFPPPAA